MLSTDPLGNDLTNLCGYSWIHMLLTKFSIHNYLLFIMAKKNNTRIERAIEGNTISVNGLSNDMLCSRYS